jgi:hypothetical protein
MQTDWLFHGLLPVSEANSLFFILGFSALAFTFFAWLVEYKAKESIGGGTEKDSLHALSYRAHPRVWNLTHRLLLGLAVFFCTVLFLFSFGFLWALTDIIFFAAMGATSRSLREVVALEAYKRREQR